ncbi:MAG: hypothetical protein WKF34_02845 [Pyrinomonadaceae bacterium]
MSNYFKLRLHLAALGTLLFATTFTIGQEPTLVFAEAKSPMSVAAGNNLYCAGFVQKGGISTQNRIIGAQDEADKYNYAQNDFLYLSMGRDKGVAVGDMFSVIRPRGGVKSKWTSKDVGFYVQEVGAVEVINVKPNFSVARVRFSCDTLLLGDLVQTTEKRTSPIGMKLNPLDRFADYTGKARGRILFARDGHEMITRDQIAYVDLGQDENVRVGDRLTIYRPLEKGNVTTSPQGEIVTSRDYGFQSERNKGSRFSNQSGRKSGEKADGREITTERAKAGRPFLRKVVGEAVVLNVKERTATIVITRTGQEIHTGDWVEIQ